MDLNNYQKKLVNIPLSKVVAMPEAERPYYDPEHMKKLQRSIRVLGFLKEKAVSGRWNEELGKYEIFVGTHRLIASQREKPKEFWMWKVLGISRKDAILLAFIDNDTNAPMNPMQKYHTFRCMLDIVKKEHKKVGAGRNPTAYARLIVNECRRLGQLVSEATIKNHLRLGELPKSSQDLIGHGKLRIKQTVLSFPLMGKIPEKELEQFLMTASKQFWKPSRVKFEVNQILEKVKGQKIEKCAICGAEIRRQDTPLRTRSQAVPSYIRGLNSWQSVCKDCLNGLNVLVDAFIKRRQERTRKLEEMRSKFARAKKL